MTTSPDEQTAAASCASLTVMFDGACPLCRREVGVYQALSPLQPVAWLDVSQTSLDLAPADRARYLARFHVRRQDGQLLSGAAAFVALWRAMPGWRWLGRIGALPGVTPVLELLYRGFLRVRPRLQCLVRKLDAAHLPARRNRPPR
jgi:predicted DCC family thiol-disulfide oxidoreductase YuxK